MKATNSNVKNYCSTVGLSTLYTDKFIVQVVMATEIIENLYLASYDVAKDVNWLSERDVHMIVNCSKDLSFPDYPVLGLRLFVEDVYTADKAIRRKENEEMTKYMDDIVDVIHRVLQQKKKVLVHCLHGVQRSATIVTAYLLKYNRKLLEGVIPRKPFTSQSYLDRAIEFVLRKRPRAFVEGKYINFASSLKAYDKHLYAK